MFMICVVLHLLDALEDLALQKYPTLKPPEALQRLLSRFVYTRGAAQMLELEREEKLRRNFKSQPNNLAIQPTVIPSASSHSVAIQPATSTLPNLNMNRNARPTQKHLSVVKLIRRGTLL